MKRPALSAAFFTLSFCLFSLPWTLLADSSDVSFARRASFWLPQNISLMGEKIDALFYAILIITGIVFVLVQGTLIYFLWKYRSGARPAGEYIEGSRKAEILWTLIPFLILTSLAFLGQAVWREVKKPLSDSKAVVQIRVKAEQYAWNMQYPGADGIFDTPDDIQKINQMNIPVNMPIQVILSSIEKDGLPAVIHSFFLPDFRIKQDAVPGMEIDVWLQANKTGKYEIACAEFCGLGHYRMRGFLTIQSAEDYAGWLAQEAAAA